MRTLLVECAELDWSGISPAIFGAVFQGGLEAHHPDETRQSSRRELGAHYTNARGLGARHMRNAEKRLPLFRWHRLQQFPLARTHEVAGQAALDARSRYPDATLADLCDQLSMPPDLFKAHQAVDKVVDAAYGYKGGKDDAPRVAFLFGPYQRLASLLSVDKKKRHRKEGYGHPGHA